MKPLLLAIMLIVAFITADAQNRSISGSVYNMKGQPVAFANVLISGTTLGTAAGITGNFEIKNLKPEIYTLVVSAVGYETIKVRVDVTEINALLTISMREIPMQTEQVVVTAGKHEQRINDLPVTVEVLESDFITQKNTFNIRDALKYVPGVNLVDDQISIRGSSGYSRGAGTRVLTAIDGIPLYTGDTGEIIWEMIPVNEIERIEILKGASSSLYGSTAVGGVINIITKKNFDQSYTYVRAMAGLYDNPYYEQWNWWNEARTFNSLSAAHTNKLGPLGFTASISRIDDYSYKQNDFGRRLIGYLKGNLTIAGNTDLVFFINSLNQVSGNFIYWKDSRNALVPPDADQGQRVKTNRQMGGFTLEHKIDSAFILNFKGSYYRTDWKDESVSRNSSIADLYRGEVLTTKQIITGYSVTGGFETVFSKVKSNIFGSPDAVSFGGYIQADMQPASILTVSAGIRYDNSRLDTIKASSSISPKIALNYKISNDVIIRASAGSGFRAPTLAEAFTSTNVSGVSIRPNPYLKPERNFNFELGVDVQTGLLSGLKAALFQNEFYDFIEPAVNPLDGQVRFANVTRARIQGFEVNYSSLLFTDDVNLTASYTYLWSRDLQKKTALKYRPRHLFYTGLSYNPGLLYLGMDFRYWSKVEQMDFELVQLGVVKDGDKRAQVFVVDISAGYTLFHMGFPGKVLLNVDNLLNYSYVELIGNLAPVRNYSISVELFF